MESSSFRALTDGGASRENSSSRSSNSNSNNNVLCDSSSKANTNSSSSSSNETKTADEKSTQQPSAATSTASAAFRNNLPKTTTHQECMLTFSSSFSSDDEESDDDDDDDVVYRNRDRKRRRSNSRNSINQSRKRSRKRQCSPSPLGKPLDPDTITTEPLPVLSDKQKKHELYTRFDEQHERDLQQLLWSIGVRFTLETHQCPGVRAIAGVHATYPGPPEQEKQRQRNNISETTSALAEAEEDIVLRKDWKAVLRETKLDEPNQNHGILLADDMGLGKTVQAVVGCMLRNIIARVQGKEALPTLLVSPNHAVPTQWIDHLIKAGVPSGWIVHFVPKDWKQPKFRGSIFVLATRYQLQTEAKYVFTQVKHNMAACPSSPLFPNTSKSLLLKLKNQYLADRGKTRDQFRDIGESRSTCITRLLEQSKNKIATCFRTVIIDEAHFLKNLVAYWGLAAGLLGLHTERMVPMSGTPYNNSAQDLATLMTFIDPSLASAREDWWKKATENGAAPAVAEACLDWKESFLIRRDKAVLQGILKEKHVVSRSVAPYALELAVYEGYETRFIQVLEKFTRLVDDHSPQALMAKKQLFENMLSCASCMRMALIHPLLPGGRDWTIQFSPTRCHLAKNLSKPNRCVCCGFEAKRPPEARASGDVIENLGDDMLDESDDEPFFVDDEADEDGRENDQGKGKGKIIEIPVELCSLPNVREGGLRHFAHESCLERLQTECMDCPLCTKLFERARLDTAKKSLLRMRQEAAEAGKTGMEDPREMAVKLEVDRPIYCKEILGGFKASAKLESVVSDIKSIPPEDKILVVSFFKGSLDLLEAILHNELKLDYARFDGDINPGERQRELDRFKTDPSCRVLLMTVQTGGTGLNIVEANHVSFMDRWFNPFVHQQCEDRCYRYGQTKDVAIAYHDVNFSIDVVMRHLNDVKSTNALIVLADGTTLGTASTGLTYKDMSGLLGNSVKAVRFSRVDSITNSSSPFSAMHAFDPSILDQENLVAARSRSAASVSILDAVARLLGIVVQAATNPNSSKHNPCPTSSHHARWHRIVTGCCSSYA